jgi:arylsulfatase A-like enzyme
MKGERHMKVVLIVIDSLRHDHVRCYGNDWIKTPNLDALAKESILFTNMHPESLPTLPSRRSIYTGCRVFPFENHKQQKGDFLGLSPGWGPIPEDQDTLSEVLQMYKHRTCLVSDVRTFTVDSINGPGFVAKSRIHISPVHRFQES